MTQDGILLQHLLNFHHTKRWIGVLDDSMTHLNLSRAKLLC